MIDPTIGSITNKKISCMNYYAYRLMIRENHDNHILKCRQLYQQYVVDTYAKIETEGLLFIRLNQRQLRSKKYIHLREEINNDGNVLAELQLYQQLTPAVRDTCMNMLIMQYQTFPIMNV